MKHLFLFLFLFVGRGLCFIPGVPSAGIKYLVDRRPITALSIAQSPYPPPPEFIAKPLPVILGGGLFLFATSVRGKDKPFAKEILRQAEIALRNDPTIGMELGQGMEAGGVFASQVTQSGDFDQMVLQFQIEGGNAWAQGVAYGVSRNDSVQLVSLEVANMDASMNGTPFEIAIPLPALNQEEKANEKD